MSSVMTLRDSPMPSKWRFTSSAIGSRSGPAISIMPLRGGASAASATFAATSADAIGWIEAEVTRATPSMTAAPAIVPTNSKNCVACTIEYGIEDFSISCS